MLVQGSHTHSFPAGTTSSFGRGGAEPTSHYGLLQTIEQAWGLPLLGCSAQACPITGIWR